MWIDSTTLVVLKQCLNEVFPLKEKLNLTDLDGTIFDAENVEFTILLKGGL